MPITHTTVSPAYGRDYPTAAKAKAAWEAGDDFILRDCTSRWDGKPINLEDARTAGFTEVNLRFNKMAGVCVVKLLKAEGPVTSFEEPGLWVVHPCVGVSRIRCG